MKKAVKVSLICFYALCILGVLFGVFGVFPHFILQWGWGDSAKIAGLIVGGIVLLGVIVAGFIYLHDWAFSGNNGGEK